MSSARLTTSDQSESMPLRALTLTTALLGGILLLSGALPAAAQAQARIVGGEEALLNRTSRPPQGTSPTIRRPR